MFRFCVFVFFILFLFGCGKQTNNKDVARIEDYIAKKCNLKEIKAKIEIANGILTAEIKKDLKKAYQIVKNCHYSLYLYIDSGLNVQYRDTVKQRDLFLQYLASVGYDKSLVNVVFCGSARGQKIKAGDYKFTFRILENDLIDKKCM